jgi:lipid-A-disaccharide synthase-like uncharacterized protein
MDWRVLLYPLGFLSSLAFGGRFALQWLSSEYHRKSMVTKGFWILSLVGNLTLATHAMIQLQYHVCLIQACNATISWRNLNLMGPEEKRYRFNTVLLLLVGATTFVTACFSLQISYSDVESYTWFRVPIHAWSSSSTQTTIPLYVHLFGFVGISLFASRFWIQWWFAEKCQQSYLGRGFWWLSLVGDLMSISYFFYIGDAVNFIGPAIGTVPYIRNLMLLRNKRREAYEATG